MRATAAYADADGRIDWTDEGFGALALEHGQRQLADGAVVGRPLLDSITRSARSASSC